MLFLLLLLLLLEFVLVTVALVDQLVEDCHVMIGGWWEDKGFLNY